MKATVESVRRGDVGTAGFLMCQKVATGFAPASTNPIEKAQKN
jgi:hypothetical protein